MLAVFDTDSAELHRTIGGPEAWNSQPSHLWTIIDTNVFKRHLKAFLFTESFA